MWLPLPAFFFELFFSDSLLDMKELTRKLLHEEISVLEHLILLFLFLLEELSLLVPLIDTYDLSNRKGGQVETHIEY